MEMFSAKVVNGRLDVPDGELPEGATVILLVAEDEEAGFTLSEEQQAELTEAMAQIRRGEWVDGWELLRELKSKSA